MQHQTTATQEPGTDVDSTDLEVDEPDRLTHRMRARAVELEAQRAAMTPKQRQTERLETRAAIHRAYIELCDLIGHKPAAGSTTRAPRPRGAGRPAGRGSSRRSSERSGDDDGESSEPPPGGRLCENQRCGADISAQHPLRRYCDDACQQAAWRDRQRDEHLDGIEGTVTLENTCVCDPKHGLVIDGVCFPCGRSRGPVVRGWDYEGVRAHPPIVAFRYGLKRHTRLGDGKRKPVESKKRLPSGEVVSV